MPSSWRRPPSTPSTNTIDKLAAGIADTWVLNTLIECMGYGVPIVLAANINPALGRHPRFRQNVAELRDWGIAVMWEPDPAPPAWMPPWKAILDELHHVVKPARS